MIAFINENAGLVSLCAILIGFALLFYLVYALNKRQVQKTAKMIRRLDERVMGASGRLRESVKMANQAMGSAGANLNAVSESMEARQERMRREMQEKLDFIRENNDRKLDEMRTSLDMSVSRTLETKLGESFRLVSGQLESVYKGLGEMKMLAGDVGDLKKVLTGVKTRGVWGEVRLRTLFEETLVKGQYEENVCVRPGSGERVEFAVKLPGSNEDAPVWMPVDSKFPVEDYQRLVNASQSGDRKEMEKCGRAFENAILSEAARISSKYISAPDTTDFAVMFLPAESLYVEVLSREGLSERLQREYRILPAGPASFQALLNCLQMGFRTVQMEKRSAEIMRMLSSVKQEFLKFGDTLNKARTRLEQAAGDLDNVGVRTRAMNRKLSEIETDDSDREDF